MEKNPQLAALQRLEMPVVILNKLLREILFAKSWDDWLGARIPFKKEEYKISRALQRRISCLVSDSLTENRLKELKR